MNYSEAHPLSTTLNYCKVVNLFLWHMVLKPRLIKKHSAKSSFLGPALSRPVPPLPLWNPLLPAISFGSSLGNDNFPVYRLSSLSRVKLQNDISFLLISPKGKQHIIQEFCVKSEHLIRLICKLFTFSVCAAMRPYRSRCSSFWLWNASPITLHLCPWQLPEVHVAS